MKTAKRITQYLDRYVIPASRNAARLVLSSHSACFSHTVCIPLYDESLDVVHRACAHPAFKDALIILVVNLPDNAPSHARQRTERLLSALQSVGKTVAQDSASSLQSVEGCSGRLTILVMDHCTPGRELPASEGVGRARKLGADVALELWHNGRVASDWLFQSDADATLPDNYFHTPDALEDSAAIHLNFEHCAPAGVSVAQQLYDLKLDHHVAGLAFAGSPYAHYSLGSALVVKACAYATVRGYPRRSAGEDFYLLNKLAKIGHVAFDSSRTVRLDERLSARVPFGTGPGVLSFVESSDPFAQRAYYSSEAYRALKRWLSFLREVLVDYHDALSGSVRDLYCVYASLEPSSVDLQALEKMDLFTWAESIVTAYRRPEQRRHQFQIGLDALKTLQLIHAFRDHGYHNIVAADAVTSLSQFRVSQDVNVVLRGNRYRRLILV